MEYIIFAHGAFLLIQCTLAVRYDILPARSLILNTNDPLPVKVYQVDPLLFITLIGLEGFIIDAVTLLFVGLVLSYCNEAIGLFLSIVLTTIGIVFDMPLLSIN